MENLITESSKYILIILIALYTYQCFSGFADLSEKKQNRVLKRQNRIMYLMQIVAYAVLIINSEENQLQILVFFLAQFVLFMLTINLYKFFYPKVSRVIVNNMCMLLSIGFIMICRLRFELAPRQLFIVCGSMVVTMLVPVIIRKMQFLDRLTWLYAAVGLALLIAVALFGNEELGSKRAILIGNFSFMPAEFVKIIFVFFVAAMLSKATNFRQVVITTIVAGAHVLILVASTDLGSALILFVVYLIMVYVATRNLFYLLCGTAGGSVAAVGAYYMFSHVRTRVLIWQDPFTNYDIGGYQIAQSLFAIAAGGWFGTGLMQGSPRKIPVVEQDFMFPAIVEELGLIFGLCMMLICVSCFIMILNVAMQIHKMFYKLIALGLGTAYIFQVFLTIGGSVKFIPLTGVTLPLVSYGGSSIIATLILFAIIQGLYILREDEDENLEKERQLQAKKAERERKKRRIEQTKTGSRSSERRSKTDRAKTAGQKKSSGKSRR